VQGEDTHLHRIVRLKFLPKDMCRPRKGILLRLDNIVVHRKANQMIMERSSSFIISCAICFYGSDADVQFADHQPISNLSIAPWDAQPGPRDRP
jgi:hypothetical protein